MTACVSRVAALATARRGSTTQARGVVRGVIRPPVLAARPVPIVGTASELPAGLSLTTRGWISRRKRELRELTRFMQDDSKTVATFLVGLVTLLFLAAAWLG